MYQGTAGLSVQTVRAALDTQQVEIQAQRVM
jgi:hypothetical protein